VNKADREGADDTMGDITGILRYKNGKGSWRPEVFKTSATNGEGITELMEELEKHENYLKKTNLIYEKKYDKGQLLDLVKERVEHHIFNSRSGEEYLGKYVKEIIEREIDPYTASEILLEKMGLQRNVAGLNGL